MNEAAIAKKLAELTEAISYAPVRGSATSAHGAEGLYIPQAPAKEASSEEIIEQLSLQVKYLLFDLEATRRENRYLRQMLEARPPFGPEESADDGGPPIG